MTTAHNAYFDFQALYTALDAKRRSRGMSWRQVALEISGTRPRAVSPSTFARTMKEWRMEADGILQMLRWLGRTPESFRPRPGLRLRCSDERAE